MYIRNIMNKEIITINEKDTVEKCAKLLSENNLNGLPVLDEKGKVKGMITEGDLIRRAADIKPPEFYGLLGAKIYLESPKKFMDKLKKSMSSIVEDVMTKELIGIGPDNEIEVAATIMLREKIKSLPVMDEEGNLLGIVSRRDIMEHLFKD